MVLRSSRHANTTGDRTANLYESNDAFPQSHVIAFVTTLRRHTSSELPIKSRPVPALFVIASAQVPTTSHAIGPLGSQSESHQGTQIRHGHSLCLSANHPGSKPPRPRLRHSGALLRHLRNTNRTCPRVQVFHRPDPKTKTNIGLSHSSHSHSTAIAITRRTSRDFGL